MNPRWKEVFLMNDKKPNIKKPSLDMVTIKRLLSYLKITGFRCFLFSFA